MIRECFNEHAETYEVTAKTQVELFEQILEFVKQQDYAGRSVTLAVHYPVENPPTLVALLYVA